MVDENLVPLDDDMVGAQKPAPVLDRESPLIEPGKNVILSNEEKTFISKLQDAIEENEFFSGLAKELDTLTSVAKKQPVLLFHVLKDAEIKYENGSLDEEIYERTKRFLEKTLNDVDYPLISQSTFNTVDARLTDTDKSFMVNLNDAIDKKEFFQELLTENDVLLNIAKKDPNIVYQAFKSAESKQDGSFPYDESLGKNERYLEAALNKVGYLDKISGSKKSPSRLKSFLAGFLSATVGIVGAAAYLNTNNETKSNVSKYASKAGYPLTPEDQVKAILENPALLDRLTERLENREGAEELMSALQSGDGAQKARALSRLKTAIDEALTTAEAVQENVTKKARSLGR